MIFDYNADQQQAYAQAHAGCIDQYILDCRTSVRDEYLDTFIQTGYTETQA